MYKKHIAVAIAAAVTVGVAINNSIQTTRQERMKREQIRLDSEKEMTAIYAAGEIVQEKIRRGDYDHGSMDDIRTDLTFYRIAVRAEND